MTLSITPLDSDAIIALSTGIDATITNHGRQHLDETQLRVFGQHLLQGIYTTQDGRSHVAVSTHCRVNGDAQSCFTAKERRLMQHTSSLMKAGECLTLEKLTWVDWTTECDVSLESWGQKGILYLNACVGLGYDALLAQSAANWQRWWQHCRVEVNSVNADDQRALDFALYHLRIMTPAHDERCSIGAKGMTGEGYKGHVFWDTEVFLLPFHLLTYPDVARKLLRYRWHNLAGAREKARINGWQGRCFHGKARAAVMKRRRSSRRSTFEPDYVRRWLLRRRNIIWWPILHGPLWRTGRSQAMSNLCPMKD